MNAEHYLLLKMTTPKGMAEVIESGLSAEVFEEPVRQAAFNFMVGYWKSQTGEPRLAPTAQAVEVEFPGVKLPKPTEVEEATGYLAHLLRRRHITNRLQDILRATARDSVTDPVGALKKLEEDAAETLKHVGKAGAGLSFEADVSSELRKLRVREEAKRRQHATEPVPFDEGLLGEVLARPEEPPFRIEGLVRSDASTLITALRKTGKTTLILNLAHSLTTGEYFLGRFPVRQIAGRVAILNFEVSGAQIARWADETGIDHGALHLVNLRGHASPFASAQQRERLAGLLKAHEVESLIIDPFGKAYTGTNENDQGEVGAFLADLDRFKTEIGAADLILTAHAGWAAERSRGSSALEDWPDSIITMVANDDGVRFLWAMGRDVGLAEDELHFDPRTRRLSLMCTGSRKTARDQAKAEKLVNPVCAQVQRNPGVSQRKIIGLVQGVRQEGSLTVSFQERDVVTAIDLAVKAGRLRREGTGARGSTYHYFFIDETLVPPSAAKLPPSGGCEVPPVPYIEGTGTSLTHSEEVTPGGTSPGGTSSPSPGSEATAGGALPGSPAVAGSPRSPVLPGSAVTTAPGSVEGTSLSSPVEASASPGSPGGSHPSPGKEVLARQGLACRSCCQPKSRLSADDLCEDCQDRNRSIGLL